MPRARAKPLPEHVERIERDRSSSSASSTKPKPGSHKEKQFNRKVEINAELRELKTELEQLTPLSRQRDH